jgi:hypothetical protein
MVVELALLLNLSLVFAQSHHYGDPCIGCMDGRWYCTEFSRGLAQQLDAAGFDSRVVFMWYWRNTSLGHAWVRVFLNGSKIDIEPQTGKIVNRTAQCTRFWRDWTRCF